MVLMTWFSEPQDTIEAAQELHQPEGLFDPAAVFSNGRGKYVMARLRRDVE